jgi:hypothetical protein
MGDPSRVRLTGPLTPFAEGFAAELARQVGTASSTGPTAAELSGPTRGRRC